MGLRSANSAITTPSFLLDFKGLLKSCLRQGETKVKSDYRRPPFLAKPVTQIKKQTQYEDLMLAWREQLWD